MTGEFVKSGLVALCGIAAVLVGSDSALAQEDSEALAKQLANPLAALISVPFQGNYNGGISLPKAMMRPFLEKHRTVCLGPEQPKE